MNKHEWLLRCFVSQGTHPQLLRDGVIAILTMDKPHLTETIVDRGYVRAEKAVEVVQWMIARPWGIGYPLLTQDDRVVREFLVMSYTMATTLFEEDQAKEFAIGVCDALVEHGRYLWARQWREICSLTEPTDVELSRWATQLVGYGEESAVEVLMMILDVAREGVPNSFKSAYYAALTERNR